MSPPIEILLASTDGLEALLGTSCACIEAWELGCRLASSSKLFFEAVRQYRLALCKIDLRDKERPWIFDVESTSMMRVVGRDCPQLQSMYLSVSRDLANSSEAIRALLRKLPELEDLCLSCTLDSRVVFTIARYCPRLKTLDIRHARALPMDMTAGMSALATCTSLTNLTLNMPLGAEAIAFLVDGLSPTLQELDFDRVFSLNSDTFAGTAWPALVRLVFHFAYGGTPSTLADFVSGEWPALGSLTIAWSDYAGLERLSSACPKLRDLSLHEQKPGQRPALARELHHLRHPLLETLNDSLTEIDLSEFRSELGCNALPSLRALNFDASLISPAAVVNFAKAAPKLSDICLSGNVDIGDDTLAALARHCRGLTRLDLFHTSCTARGIRVLQGLPLTDLQIDSMEDLCDDDLRFISTSFPQLATILLPLVARGITIAGVQELIAASPFLKEVADDQKYFFECYVDQIVDRFGDQIGDHAVDEADEAELEQRTSRRRVADECLAMMKSRY